jgi:hypothetical protein
VDGYSHHEQKKKDLQVEKKGWFMQGGQNEAKMKARGGLTEKASLLCVYMSTYLSLIRYLRITVLCV